MDGNYEAALNKWNEVVKIKPSSLIYAKRADVYLKLKKLNNAIADCNAALALNPDSAKSLKTRGMAYRYLGRWELAAHDLQEGNKIDFDETAFEIEKVVSRCIPILDVALTSRQNWLLLHVQS